MSQCHFYHIRQLNCTSLLLYSVCHITVYFFYVSVLLILLFIIFPTPDRDECINSADNVCDSDPYSECINTLGSYKCQCVTEGYYLDDVSATCEGELINGI